MIPHEHHAVSSHQLEFKGSTSSCVVINNHDHGPEKATQSNVSLSHFIDFWQRFLNAHEHSTGDEEHFDTDYNLVPNGLKIHCTPFSISPPVAPFTFKESPIKMADYRVCGYQNPFRGGLEYLRGPPVFT